MRGHPAVRAGQKDGGQDLQTVMSPISGIARSLQKEAKTYTSTHRLPHQQLGHLKQT
jgi:hypothetical protein